MSQFLAGICRLGGLVVMLTLLWVATTTTLAAQANPSPNKFGWMAIASGLEYRAVRPPSGGTFHQLRTRIDCVQLKLLSAKDYQEKSMRCDEFLKRSGAVAVLNGGYFDPENQPMGYQRDSDRVLQSEVWTRGLFGGVFYLDSQQVAHVVGREDFVPAQASFALQCGPRLVYRREKMQGIHDDPAARRTVIGVDRSGRYLFGVSDVDCRLRFGQLQDLLLSGEAQGGFNAEGVLNLDGGSSTQASIKTKKFQSHIVGLQRATAFGSSHFISP